MAIVYQEEDGNLDHLRGKFVAVIGYGNLGRPAAMNLRDSNVRVVVGSVSEERQQQALKEGFNAFSIAEAVQQARIIMLLLPDEVMPQVYLEQVAPYLQRGDTLIFANAYNIAFGFIEAPPFVDVGLIAPRTLGDAVRARQQTGAGFYSFVAVGQDATGEAWTTVLALARAVGSLQAGAIEISFEQEAHLDLFIQQAVVPAFHHIIVSAAHLLIENGYPPEAVLTELYIGGEFSDYLERASQEGLLRVLRRGSKTSQYGTFTRLERYRELKLERLMEITLDEIRSGDFAQEWAREFRDGHPRLDMMLRHQENLDVWELERQTLDMLYPYRDDHYDLTDTADDEDVQ